VRFAGKVALVTGSSRNIGKEIVTGFVQGGGSVIVNAATSADELEATAEELRAMGGDVLAVLADTSSRDTVEDLVAKSIERFGKIDVLVLNHSIRPAKPFLEVTDEDFEHLLGVNLRSAFYLLQTVLPHMVDQESGSVISMGFPGVGGRGGQHSPPRMHINAIFAAKHAMVHWGMREFSRYGIRFNFVAPGLTATVRKNAEWYPNKPDGKPQEDPVLLAHVPLGRPGLPSEVAQAVLFLASDDASYINGTLIKADGGLEL
jgi:3-oxoacyl-[acyl-carrier protein] reductase